jgi:hypothetical protein
MLETAVNSDNSDKKRELDDTEEHSSKKIKLDSDGDVASKLEEDQKMENVEDGGNEDRCNEDGGNEDGGNKVRLKDYNNHNTFRVFAIDCKIIRIMSGMAGLSYEN